MSSWKRKLVNVFSQDKAVGRIFEIGIGGRRKDFERKPRLNYSNGVSIPYPNRKEPHLQERSTPPRAAAGVDYKRIWI
ncbi:hypothetical protein L6164_010096 [Bauhinia variegata]|uniref:Uncharacterized protein n=1 Tax=Bauhinia variegata TaxID=167791 RepID=A0ACB9PLV0_BAUVA|nr:hypothetical protein L6164_010096 [Bauhinia variegata]